MLKILTLFQSSAQTYLRSTNKP